MLPGMSLIGLGLGLVFVTRSGLNWLGTIDGFINGTWGIAFLGFLECIALGWFYRVERLRVRIWVRAEVGGANMPGEALGVDGKIAISLYNGSRGLRHGVSSR